MRLLWLTKYRHWTNGPEKKGKIENPPPGSLGQGVPGLTRWGSTLPRFTILTLDIKVANLLLLY